VASLDALAKVLPVLLLFGLGAVLRRGAFLQPATIGDLRRLVLYVTLPAALFPTFLRVTLEPQYAVIVASVFLACVAVLAAGPLVGRLVGLRSPLLPGLLAGFEGGMLGYAIYGGVFGLDELYHFAIVDLGQVPFVFFVLATWLTRRASGRSPTLRETATAMARTPVVLAIVAGVAGSALGLGPALEASPLGEAVLRTLGLVGAMTTPLIAIVIGYSTRLRRGALGAPLRTVGVRLTIWVVLAIAFNVVVIDGLLGLDRLFQAAVMTMAVLPPPFVIPLYLHAGARRGGAPERDPANGGDADGADDPIGGVDGGSPSTGRSRITEVDQDYVVSTLSLGTVATLVAFLLVGVVYSS